MNLLDALTFLLPPAPQPAPTHWRGLTVRPGRGRGRRRRTGRYHRERARRRASWR